MLLKILFMGKTNILNNLYFHNVILSSIAIIVAFNESFPGGIGITMAICTEEFLRKINDFAVLMTMGMNTHEGNFKLSSRALRLKLSMVFQRTDIFTNVFWSYYWWICDSFCKTKLLQ